ncbi:phosphoglucosamine mutase [Syntrophus aciditrophicus]|uniref:Phosphoglucosamine mutase n=1 Tax=Syntrophus aciditrophicus (strain SB) TaxID=56780 RepID=GLMM_SYNAS|nr:phosphoglucosamine mutase [Syntrophus aciditrophicus]Q2LRC1.1 RecName: Full=Phosphoglucosamine mutase [Syntrophus aciditrophicus SB]ABC76632.1 phosphoglucosamine mutase [Syntrophus aciditrophicus SB]OPY16917.1 MAG: Phosphoglucosamine mutase [Syntrophus sp. PtaB.Bin075]
MGKLFGTDGVRGVANEYPMTAEMALNIGRATAFMFKREGHNPKILIGKDTRLSGYMLENALVSGICSMGVNAILVGVIPTPGIAYLTSSMRADAGIVISASHNPFQDNGIKIFSGDGFKLPDETELAIEDMILNNKMDQLLPRVSELGKAYRMDDARGRYIVFLKHTFPRELSLEGVKVVLDCANGATYRVAPETFYELGAEVTTLFDDPDGRNINVNCGSQYPETLAAEVLKQGADVGFAFDGDGDRLIAVDEKGNVLTGDQVIAICANVMKKEGKLTKNLVVRTVMSNIGLSVALEKLDINSIMTKVGDRYVLEEMQANGSSIGGEDSGHVIFLQHHTTGDGIVTAIQVIAAMKKEGKPLSDLAKIMDVFPQTLINVDTKSRPEISTVPELVAVIKSVEEKLGTSGRVLVRYSGTQNMCRVMVEGPTQEETLKYCKQIADVVKEELG